MDRFRFRVENLKAMHFQQMFKRREQIIDKMLMVNLVERQIVHHLLQIDELDDKDAVIFQK